MDKSIDAIRTDLQSAIDKGQLNGIRSDGVNTNKGMAVDTMSKQADPAVADSVTVSNNAQLNPVADGLNQGINKAVSTPAPEPTPVAPESPVDKLQSEILGTDLAAQRQQARADLKTAEKEKTARTLGDALTGRQREMQRQREQLEKNEQGQFGGGLSASLAKFNRESARELADMSFSYSVALGDYNAAEKLAQEYMSDYSADLQAKQNAWQMLFTMQQNDMTESEKLQAQQAFSEKQSEKTFEMQKQMALYNAQLEQSDPMYKAKLAAAQLTGTGAPKIVKVNGVDSIFNSETGQFEPAPVSSSSDGLTPLGKLQKEEKISQVDDLINNSYLNNAVGTNRLARLSPASVVTAGKSDFVASVGQLVSSLSLTELQNAKAQGATFGALSNAEWEILGASATQISKWQEEKLFGKKTEGFKTSPAKFQAELDKINRFASMDYIIKGGLPEDIGLITTDDGNIWYENADKTLTQLERTLD